MERLMRILEVSIILLALYAGGMAIWEILNL